MGFTFPPRACPGSLKRGRAAADIDGEHSNLQKKKRRLRLFLITSRLSPQFSHPATNIVNRGSSKIAVWAKQKSPGRNLLRKAAILNRVRRGALLAKEAQQGRGRVLVEQEREQEQLRLARLAFQYGSVDTYTRPVVGQGGSIAPAGAVRTGGQLLMSGSPSSSRSPSPTSPSPPRSEVSSSEYRSPNEAYSYSMPRAQVPRKDYHPLGPSPLGLSNYDAFDMEDEIPDPYSHLDDDDHHDDHHGNHNGEDDDEDGYTHTFPYHNNNHDNEDDDYDECPFSPTAITTPPHFTTTTTTTPPPTQTQTQTHPHLFPSAQTHPSQLPPIPPSFSFSLLSPEDSNTSTSTPTFPSIYSTPSTPISANKEISISTPPKDSRADSFTRKDSAAEQERFRRRNLIFGRFGG